MTLDLAAGFENVTKYTLFIRAVSENDGHFLCHKVDGKVENAINLLCRILSLRGAMCTVNFDFINFLHYVCSFEFFTIKHLFNRPESIILFI